MSVTIRRPARRTTSWAAEAPRSSLPHRGGNPAVTRRPHMTRHAQPSPSRPHRFSRPARARIGAQRRLPVHGDRGLLTLIDRAYDAATNGDAWRALLEALAHAVSCEAVGLNLQDLKGGPATVQCQIGVDWSWQARYETYFAPRNIFLAARPDLTFSGAIRNGEAIVPDHQAMRTEYFNDFLRPLGLLHAIGMVPLKTGSVASLLSLMRRIGAPSFADADFALLARFMPHLQRAITIHQRLEAVDLGRSAASEALDRMTIGVVILDQDGKAIFLNKQSETVLAQRDGLLLTRDGLACACSGEGSVLRCLVAQACGTGARRDVLPGGTLHVTRRPPRRPLSVLVAPLRVQSFALASSSPAAVVFIGDPERKVEGVGSMLRTLYGLTPAEAAVANLLLEGLRTDQLADRLGITLLTARTHVKRVLSKVDARTQADLVRILLSGPAGLRIQSP
jgi:DNA-binding CsgD family transcriptional regulator